MKDSKKDILSAIERREFSIAELRKQIIDNSTRDLSGSGHRTEHVGTVNGIEFINDSGATSASLAWFSLERVEGEAIWIVGSLQEGQDYSDLKEVVRGKVKGIVCLGRESSKVYKTFMACTEVIVGASTAEEAVRAALALAKPGQKVILSPACPSLDMFESYEDRGNQFTKAVGRLIKNE
jgi:UDP-N-acetylmuramoylalanine--D-glutamate ligase